MQSIINDITGYSISRNLLGQALLATAGFEAPGTTYPCATHDNALVREHYYLQASCGLLEADIKGCFDNISHDWLLAHIPMDKQILRKWLKAGYMDKGSFNLTRAGTPQGGLCAAAHKPPYEQYRIMYSVRL